jgi:hypothetical protein
MFGGIRQRPRRPANKKTVELAALHRYRPACGTVFVKEIEVEIAALGCASLAMTCRRHECHCGARRAGATAQRSFGPGRAEGDEAISTARTEPTPSDGAPLMGEVDAGRQHRSRFV